MYNYCTLFDSNYLTRGLAMYDSLKANAKYFHLYIFAFDDDCYEILKKLNLTNVTLIALSEFEDIELLKVKKERTLGEYCWTCTPSVIKYSIEQYGLDSCTYIDSDIYFFSDPSVLIEEMGNNSILLTKHNYTPKYDQSTTSGIYCVQFMTFKNDDIGMNALNWWRNACIKWCYAKYEDGKFGDQKYLDDWTVRFDNVHILQNLGGGIAPWNVQQYNISDEDFEIIFYHFHGLKFLKYDKLDLGNYSLTNDVIKLVYVPYITHVEDINIKIKLLKDGYDHTIKVNKKDIRYVLMQIKRFLTGTYNIYSKKQLLG